MSEMEYVYDQLQELHTLIASLREEVATLQIDNAALQSRVTTLESQVAQMRIDAEIEDTGTFTVPQATKEELAWADQMSRSWEE